MAQITKILFLGDPLRHKQGQDGNADLFFGLMSGPIERVSGLKSLLFNVEELKDLQYALYSAYGFDVKQMNKNSTIFGGMPFDSWSQLCFAEPNKETLKIVKEYFSGALVVCREPALLIKKALNQLHIPMVEFAIHSVRYLDDLVLAATSNQDIIYEKLKKYEMNKEYFYFHADLIKAETYRKYSYYFNSIKQPSAVFFAQTPVDRSLLDMKNHRLVSFFDYQDKFEKLTRDYRNIYYKSHPHYKNQAVLDFIKKYPNVSVLDNTFNTYELLSLPNIKKCVAISSGVINEARYFGKETETYLDQPYHYSDEQEDKSLLKKEQHYITLNNQYMTASFWADILSPLIKTRPIFEVANLYQTNRFRRCIGSSWGFIDNSSQYVLSRLENLDKRVDEGQKSIVENDGYHRKTYYLLGFIPFLSYKYEPETTYIKVFGVVVWKIKKHFKSPTYKLKQHLRYIGNYIKSWLKPHYYNLIILDNFEPSFLKTGFRVQEFNYLLTHVEKSVLLTFSPMIDWFSSWRKEKEISWNRPASLEDYKKNRVKYLQYFPQIKPEQIQLMEYAKIKATACYIMFLYNAYISINFLEYNRIPFCFTLFPGGGFCFDQPLSDKMLSRVCSSPMFRGCYCSQKCIYDYMLKKNFAPEEKIFYQYGGGFFNMTKEEVVEKKFFRKDKETFDIAFVAYRYMDGGRDKGFDLAMETMTILLKKYPFIHFHNVGTHDWADYDRSKIVEYTDRIHFYGSQKPNFFPEFFSKIDILLSPNRSNVLRPGAFDGFPLGVEGSFCGAALFCSDPLDINTEYENHVDLEIIPLDSKKIAEKISYYIEHLEELYSMSAIGQAKVQKIFDRTNQEKQRKIFLEHYLNISVK